MASDFFALVAAGVADGAAASASAAGGAAVGGSALRLLVPSECAGRLIGRRGAHIHEAQLRSGARIQLSDRGEEKLVEVQGSWASVEEAVAQVVEDVARVADGARRRGEGPAGGQAEEPLEEASDRPVAIAALVPEALISWVAAGAAPIGIGGRGALRTCALGVEGVEASALGPWDVAGERRVALSGAAANVCQALRVLDAQLRRYARWTSRCIHEVDWDVCDHLEAEDPDAGFISTENYSVVFPEGAHSVLSGEGALAAFVTQLQEDTGAVLRVHHAAASVASGAAACGAAVASPETGGVAGGGLLTIEIAGSFHAKLKALLEASLLATLLAERLAERPAAGGGSASPGASDAAGAAADAAEPGASVELLLPGAGASGALPPDEVVRVASAPAVEASASHKRRGAGGRCCVRLRGRRGPCCAAAVRLARAAERRAASWQSEHGPPSLLVDYVTRWLGRDASHWLGAAAAAGRRARQALPRSQIASGAGVPRDVMAAGAKGAAGAIGAPGHAPAGAAHDAAEAAPALPEFGPQARPEGHGSADGPEEGAAGAEDPAAAAPTPAERRRGKRRRRLRLPSPFRGTVRADADGEQSPVEPAMGGPTALVGALVGYSDDDEVATDAGASDGGGDADSGDADLSLAAAAVRAAVEARAGPPGTPAEEDMPHDGEGSADEEESSEAGPDEEPEGGQGLDPLWERRQELLRRLAEA